MNDREYINKVLKLAVKGAGKVSPNPLVGALIVKNGSIVGSGYHNAYGEDHAEIRALKSADKKANGGTLFCNLEPCSHSGKTPPCTDALISAGIKRVVIGMEDPNPLIHGKGIAELRRNNILTDVGIMQDECERLNQFFVKYITTGCPYVCMKVAQSLDGKIARKPDIRSCLSSDEALRYVHKIRAEYDAVLIGKRTARIDDPLLTTRYVRGKTPQRIILDKHLECSGSLRIFKTLSEGPVCIATASQDRKRMQKFKEMGVGIINVPTDNDGRLELLELLRILGKRHVSSLLVEGGAKVFSSFLQMRLVDRVVFIISPVLFGDGLNGINKFSTNGDYISIAKSENKSFGKDTVVTGAVEYVRD